MYIVEDKDKYCTESDWFWGTFGCIKNRIIFGNVCTNEIVLALLLHMANLVPLHVAVESLACLLGGGGGGMLPQGIF